jgi:hypothetical protein
MVLLTILFILFLALVAWVVVEFIDDQNDPGDGYHDHLPRSFGGSQA